MIPGTADRPAVASGRAGPAVDLRLAVPAAFAWFAAAVFGPGALRGPWLAVAVAMPVVLVSRMAGRRLVAAAAMGVVIGSGALGVAVAALHRGPVAVLARLRATADLDLTLTRDPVQVTSHSGRPLTVVDATVHAARTQAGGWQRDRAPVVLFDLTGSWHGLLPGQRVITAGRLLPPRSGDPVAAAVFARAPPQLVGRPPFWQRWAGRVRGALRTACAGLGSDERGLVPGLVLGDVSAMPPSLTSAFRVTGLSHLNAVSGANVAIVLGVVIAVVRRAGIGRRLRVVVAGTALAGFVVLVRPSPSVLRAAVMGAVVLLALLAGRRVSPVPVLSAAVLGLVVVDPFLARSPGFAMSVSATAAIVLLAPSWTRRLSSWLPGPVAAAIAVPAAAQLACTPVLVATFGQLTPYAVVANVLAAPAVAPATLAGICCAMVAVGLPALASTVAWVASLPAAWLSLVARTLAAAPGAGVTWPTGWRGLGLLLMLVMPVVLALMRRHWRRTRAAAAAGRGMLATWPP